MQDPMDDTTRKPELAPELVAEIARIAAAENRPPSELLADMLSSYLKEQRWQKLVGEAKANGRGMQPRTVEAAVHKAVADFRKERGR